MARYLKNKNWGEKKGWYKKTNVQSSVKVSLLSRI